MPAPYDVPPEMRDFAERSVAQARKAFEGFMGAVHKTTEVAETAGAHATTSAKDVSTKAVGFAENNVNAAFDLAERLVKAKDVNEVLSIQTDFVKTQLAAIQAQTRELGEAVQSGFGVKR